jgi:hypothetical protein
MQWPKCLEFEAMSSRIGEFDVDLQGIILTEDDFGAMLCRSGDQARTLPNHLISPYCTGCSGSSKPQTVAVFANQQMKSRASLKKEAVKLKVEEEGTGALKSARVMRRRLQDFSFTASAKVEDSPFSPTTGMSLLLRHSV